MSYRVVLIGPLPPPVYGLSSTNDVVLRSLKEFGAEVVVINTSRLSLDVSILARLKRLNKILIGLVRLLLLKRYPLFNLYMSVSGGYGQVYEIMFILLAKFKGVNKIYLRHASYAYMTNKSVLARALVYMAGKKTIHITQCRDMARALCSIYGATEVIPISNVVLYSNELPYKTKKTVHTIGYMSNISFEKGVIEYLNLMEIIQEKGVSVQGLLAGPFQDKNVERVVSARLEYLGNIQYLGPVYDEKKDMFYDEIDVFIFPTKYENETEAKVNLEALKNGLPVIAYGRGCIPEILDSSCGKVVSPNDEFAPAAFKQIRYWLENPREFESASKAAAEKFLSMREKNTIYWRTLLRDISGFL